MKKILLVTTVGGFVPQFEIHNVRILQDMGYEVHYASNFHMPVYRNGTEKIKENKIICHQVDFVRSPFSLRKNIRAFRQLREILKMRYELVHCHTPMGGVLARLAALPYRKKGMRVVYTAHGFHFYRGAPFLSWICFYPIERLLAHWTDILITINEEDYQRAKQFHLPKGGSVKKVNGVGIEIKKYAEENVDDQKSIREEFGLSEHTLLFLSVGELNRNKNQGIFLEALKEFKKKNCHTEFSYLICGEGEQKEKLEKKIKFYGLQKNVFLLGYRNDISHLLKEADVYVLLSFREGLSLSLQEAMAAGKPVIASDIRGNRELIEDKRGGWLVSPTNRKELKGILEQIEKASLHRMGEFNRKKIKAYDRQEIGRAMKKIYQSCNAQNNTNKRGIT